MGYIEAIIILGGINIIAVLGVAILTGYTGLFTIGHAGFMALGGYFACVLVKELHLGQVATVLFALPAGGLFAGLCSFIIGYPAFRSRLRGDYFAVATYGFAEAVRLLLNNQKTLGSIKLGAAFGYQSIPLGLVPVPVVLLVAVLALFFAHMFVTSQFGKNCIAIGQDETAAQMMGVNLLRTKLLGLFISAFYAGVAGGLLGLYFGYLNPSFFDTQKSSDLLAAVVFGGVQSLIGPFVTGFVLVGVPELLRQFAEYRLILYGFLFVVVMIFRPQGLLGYVEMNLNFARVWWNKLIRRTPAGAAGG
jgi:branched-chain amino acid transport system permease protein